MQARSGSSRSTTRTRSGRRRSRRRSRTGRTAMWSAASWRTGSAPAQRRLLRIFGAERGLTNCRQVHGIWRLVLRDYSRPRGNRHSRRSQTCLILMIVAVHAIWDSEVTPNGHWDSRLALMDVLESCCYYNSRIIYEVTSSDVPRVPQPWWETCRRFEQRWA